MDVPRKPPMKIEGRKRMQASGLTVAWHGTRSLKDWGAYLENGSERGRLVLADRVSERALKGLLARIQSLSRAELEAMARPVGAQGGGPPVRGAGGGSDDAPPSSPSSSTVIVQSASGRQLALSGASEGQAPAVATSRRRRLPATVGSAPPTETRRPARAAARDLAGTVRQLRSRVEHLEDEQEQLRTDLAMLRGEGEPYEGPPSIFLSGWFRATLVLIVFAILVVLTVPWLMDLFEGGPREPRPPAMSPGPEPGGR
jgi:hypothetical protein